MRKLMGIGGNQARVAPGEPGEKVLDLYVDDDGVVLALTDEQVRNIKESVEDEKATGSEPAAGPLAVMARHRTGTASSWVSQDRPT